MAQPWPSASLESCVLSAGALYRSVAERCLSALATTSPAGSAGLARLQAACAAARRDGGGDGAADPSVLDGFLYAATAAEGEPEAAGRPEPQLERMASHTDPGVFTVKRASDVPGVEFLVDGAWLTIEQLAGPDDLLVWAADQLQTAASAEGSRIRAVEHRAPRRALCGILPWLVHGLASSSRRAGTLRRS